MDNQPKDSITIQLPQGFLAKLQSRDASVRDAVPPVKLSSHAIKYIEHLRLQYIMDKQELSLQDTTESGVRKFLSDQASIEATITVLTFLLESDEALNNTED